MSRYICSGGVLHYTAAEDSKAISMYLFNHLRLTSQKTSHWPTCFTIRNFQVDGLHDTISSSGARLSPLTSHKFSGLVFLPLTKILPPYDGGKTFPSITAAVQRYRHCIKPHQPSHHSRSAPDHTLPTYHTRISELSTHDILWCWNPGFLDIFSSISN